MRGIILLLLLLFLLPLSGSAEVISKTFNLGATGYVVGDLSFNMRKWNGTAWEAASSAGLTLNDELAGDYTIGTLPDAIASERYSVTVAWAASPNVGLWTYHYGADPGTRIIYREEITPPSEPRVFKQHDTYGAITVVVTRGLPSAISTATATFTLRDRSDNTTPTLDQAAVISNVSLDVNSGTYGANFTYDLVAPDLDEDGTYLGEFEITYADTTKQTVPVDDRLMVTVLPDYNDG